jgi:hypothetical protein
MRVDVLALDGVFDLGLSAVLDAFQTANELIEISGLVVSPFEVRVVGVRKAVKTAQGLSVPIREISSRPPDCVVVPAIGFKMPGPLEAALARPDVRDAAEAPRMGSPCRNNDRCLHRNFHNGRVRPARSSARDHNMVASSVLSQAISQRFAG